MVRERKTPQQLDAEAKIKEKQKELQEARIQRDSAVLKRAFSTEDGVHALKLIMGRCMYQNPITYVHAGLVDKDSMVHNAALQGLYLWLRKHLDRETLIKVEIDEIEETLETPKGKE